MAYISKNSSGLLNTKLTDVGRRKISQGGFKIQYFQIGDSEVCYSAMTNFNSTNNVILEPSFNAQNDSGSPQSNKQNVKYPFYVLGNKGNTFGIPIIEPAIYPVYNTTESRGFFNGVEYNWQTKVDSPCNYTPLPSPQCPNYYVKTSDYVIETCALCGTEYIDLIYSPCNTVTTTTTIDINCVTICQNSGLTCDYQVGDYLMIYFDIEDTCGGVMRPFPILTYQIQEINGLQVKLDRPTPFYLDGTCGQITTTTTTNANNETYCCKNARVLIYPSGMTPYYDSNTPLEYLTPKNVGFNNYEVPGVITPPIWNMNIPWSENPAGLNNNFYEGFENFGSQTYVGSKEYFGYQTNSGQTFNVSSTNPEEITDTYYYNSFDDIVYVEPKDQKAIAIIHFTNNSLQNLYGEKFAMEPYNPEFLDQTGFGRNFKLTMPTLMWHKSSTGEMGEIFYVDPPGFDEYNLFEVKYMESAKNSNMNDPGLRYYHLYDTHPNTDGKPSRIGKVFPDLKQIVIDDEEIVAALSYKSNRNWTLPAPRLSLVTPNVCGIEDPATGILSANTEYLYISYLFDNPSIPSGMHSNYYSKIQGPSSCLATDSQNVSVKFGDEFPFLVDCCLRGIVAKEFKIIAQKVTGDTKPDPRFWKVIDFTSQLTGTTSFNDNITASGMTGQTFIITNELYTGSPLYNLADYISLPLPTQPEIMNFGDEFFFYGNVETDIQATIYEMKVIVNVPSNSFTNTTNPTWNDTYTPYISEIGIYDDNKDLIIISKLQSPQLRTGVQQFVVQLDF
jgi:hypothetical protein